MSTIDLDALRKTRAENPGKIAEVLANRKRRELLRGDGKLFIAHALPIAQRKQHLLFLWQGGHRLPKRFIGG
ncbi:MAG: hypothetical protein RSC50_04360, partial [Aurantimicrobium sp.]